MMRRVNFQELTGTEQYEGFCVDMLHELADILKFRFQIKLVDDGLYGAPEPNGSWTGMVGELINRVWLKGKPQCYFRQYVNSTSWTTTPNMPSIWSSLLNRRQRMELGGPSRVPALLAFAIVTIVPVLKAGTGGEEGGEHSTLNNEEPDRYSLSVSTQVDGTSKAGRPAVFGMSLVNIIIT